MVFTIRKLIYIEVLGFQYLKACWVVWFIHPETLINIASGRKSRSWSIALVLRTPDWQLKYSSPSKGISNFPVHHVSQELFWKLWEGCLLRSQHRLRKFFLTFYFLGIFFLQFVRPTKARRISIRCMVFTFRFRPIGLTTAVLFTFAVCMKLSESAAFRILWSRK